MSSNKETELREVFKEFDSPVTSADYAAEIPGIVRKAAVLILLRWCDAGTLIRFCIAKLVPIPRDSQVEKDCQQLTFVSTFSNLHHTTGRILIKTPSSSLQFR